jgi:hypothetical protein
MLDLICGVASYSSFLVIEDELFGYRMGGGGAAVPNSGERLTVPPRGEQPTAQGNERSRNGDAGPARRRPATGEWNRLPDRSRHKGL